jgi:hypothetical protein
MAVSGLTDLSNSSFAEDGAQWTTFEGYIEWVSSGQPAFRIDNNVLSGDPSLNISNRLISEEPMAIIMNLAISGAYFT